MANIKVTLDYILTDGTNLTFKAPCDCSDVTGLIVYYPSPISGMETSKEFTFVDAHNNNLGNIDDLFLAGTYVKVVLNTVNNKAYIQNADTNAYLEGKFLEMTDWVSISSIIDSDSISAKNSSNTNSTNLYFPVDTDLLNEFKSFRYVIKQGSSIRVSVTHTDNKYGSTMAYVNVISNVGTILSTSVERGAGNTGTESIDYTFDTDLAVQQDIPIIQEISLGASGVFTKSLSSPSAISISKGIQVSGSPGNDTTITGSVEYSITIELQGRR